MSLTFLLIAGVLTGVFFDVVALGAICFGLALIGVGCAAAAGDLSVTTTLAVGVLVLQMGYVAGVLVGECELSLRSGANFPRDPRE